jgi:hypothetical protein
MVLTCKYDKQGNLALASRCFISSYRYAICMRLVCIIVMYHVPIFYIPIACLENLVSNFNFVQDAGKKLEIYDGTLDSVRSLVR